MIHEGPPREDPEDLPSHEQHEIKPSVEISREVIEAVMAKVQDIDEYGTAFHSVHSMESIAHENSQPAAEYKEDECTLRRIFSEGLLGVAKGKGNWRGGADITKEEWAQNVRRKREGSVYFNIVGRIEEKDGLERRAVRGAHIGRKTELDLGHRGDTEIGRTRYINGNIFILFDLAHFDETISSNEEDYGVYHGRTKTYNVDHITFVNEKNLGNVAQAMGFTEMQSIEPARGQIRDSLKHGRELDVRDSLINERGDIIVDPENGFILHHRVSPRFFRGIVIVPRRDRTSDETLELESMCSDMELEDLRGLIKAGYNSIETLDPEICEKIAQRILEIQLKAYQDKPELLVPIYDTQGNMWWPRKMPYEEVKRYVAEREKEKEA